MKTGFLLLSLLVLGGGVFAAEEDAGKVVLAVGNVRMAGVPLRVGDGVHVGAKLETGGDGYLYLKTVDNGFLILRPNSAATVVAYHVDAARPEASRFKIDLDRGVARSISGEAVKSARRNFRFNTPVAAIGVRGTDFTAYADSQVTRVVVFSGGVAVSGFGETCGRDGSGPCEGANVRELFAGQGNFALQIGRGQRIPQLIKNPGGLPEVAPPRVDEPPVSSLSHSPVGTADANLEPLKINGVTAGTHDAPVPVPPAPGPATAVQWGRWQWLADQKPDLDLSAVMANYKIEAANVYFALLRPKDAQWESPTTGAVDFRLQSAQAAIQPVTGGVYAVGVDSGRLHVDFGQSTFSTSLVLVADDQRIARQAEGRVLPGGYFQNGSQFVGNSNMLVQGVLGRDTTLRAGYLFQSRLDDGRVAYGATIWAK